MVTLDGRTYSTVNNGDGTWTLNGGKISPALKIGTYDVAVEATDPVGNVAHDTTTNELTILVNARTPPGQARCTAVSR